MAASIRNPLAGFALAILMALGLTAVGAFACTFVPYLEFRLFFLGFAAFGAGAISGRKTYMGFLGFVGAYLGSFVGLYVVELLFWTNSWMELLALVLASAGGLGGFLSGKVGMHRLDRITRMPPGLRRCSNCGVRVGTSARKCWSCKATLTY